MQEPQGIRDQSLWSGRSPGGGNGNPLQYSCLENPMDRGAWWATKSEVHGVRESQKTRLSEHECTQLLQKYPLFEKLYLGLAVRIPGFHPGGPGLTPIVGVPHLWASPMAQVVKNPPAMQETQETWVQSSKCNPLQHSCLENPRDRGVWRAIVHGVTTSGT